MEHRRKHDRHRPRGWFSLYLRLGGWVALIFGGALFVLTLFSAGFDFAADQVDRAGNFTTGAVVSKRVELVAQDVGEGIPQYFVTFAYKTSDGGQVAEAWVSEGYYHGADPGDEAKIRYLVAEPGTIEWDLSSYRDTAGVLRWVGLGLGVLGLAALWFFGQRANRAILARRDGDKRFGEVVGIQELNVQVNNRRQGRLMWREEDGQMGESLMRDLNELGRLYKAGDRIVVFRLGNEAYWEGDVGPPKREVGRA